MAYDLILGRIARDVSRGGGRTSSTIGAEAGSDYVVVEKSGMGFWGWMITISLGSRILTGKWPWFWAGQMAKRLEGGGPQRPVFP